MNCYDCIYRKGLPGSAHSKCTYPGTRNDIFDFLMPQNSIVAIKLNIQCDSHGFLKGYFLWPSNFDPTWLRNCDGFMEKEGS